METLIGIFFIFICVAIYKTTVIVPQQQAYVIEFLGKYSRTLDAGFNVLLPFADRIAYRHSRKEEAIDIPEQVCITSDNVQVAVDGILYVRILDPERASYGIGNYLFAVSQLTQTTLRSEIGKLELDKTFEARAHINANVVSEVDKASEAWGVKVLRYEIKNIIPPQDVLSAMEKQMRAEREKRASVLTSEGERDSKINAAEGDKQRVIKQSEAERERQVNEAQGQAEAILSVAKATAEGLKVIGLAIAEKGGSDAVQLRIAESFIQQFGKIAQQGNTIVLPANLADIGSMVTLAKGLLNSDDNSASKSIVKTRL